MALHSRRSVLAGIATTTVALAGCTGPAFDIPVTVTNSTATQLAVSVSLAEKKLFDGVEETWTLGLDAGETVERRLGGGGRPAEQFRLDVEPEGREPLTSTLQEPVSVAVDIAEDFITVSVSTYSGEVTTTASTTSTASTAATESPTATESTQATESS